MCQVRDREIQLPVEFGAEPAIMIPGHKWGETHQYFYIKSGKEETEIITIEITVKRVVVEFVTRTVVVCLPVKSSMVENYLD